MGRASVTKLMVLAAVLFGSFIVGSLAGVMVERKSIVPTLATYLTKPISRWFVELPPKQDIIQYVTAGRSDGEAVSIRSIRQFVHANSVNKIDEEYYDYATETEYVVVRLLQSARGENSPPHLECSSRSLAMKSLLEMFGHQARIVHLWPLDREAPAHTFLEVLDRELGAWVAQGPDYDVEYRSVTDKRLLSVMDMMRMDTSEFEPCRDTENCGWSYAEALKQLLTVAVYFEWDTAPTVLISESRFNDGEGSDLATLNRVSEKTWALWGKDYGEATIIPVRDISAGL